MRTAPSLSHPSGFAPSQTARVQRSTGQAHAQTMGQFVDDDPGLEITVTVRCSGAPQVHPAPAVLAIWRRHEVGIVESASILRVRDHSIILLATATKVVLLEIARNFVETVSDGSAISVQRKMEGRVRLHL